MADDTHYYSIEKQTKHSVKIKRSEFICVLEPVETLAQAKTFISQVSKKNRIATHNCWAYIVGDQARTYHCSDAGEPSGTAGKPMLNAFFHHKLTDVAAVVTRNYGGVKLGVRGLMDAYFNVVDETVAKSSLKSRIQVICVTIHVRYEFNDPLLNQLGQYQIDIQNTVYTDKVSHRVDVAKKDGEKVKDLLEQYRLSGHLAYNVNPTG